MANVSLRRGDTLNIVWSASHQTPLGDREIESHFAFTYDELLLRLRSDSQRPKAKKSGTNGARFSRTVALVYNAVRKGRWATGVKIDRDQVLERMLRQYHKLESYELADITANAKNLLVKLFLQESDIQSHHRQQLHAIVDCLGLLQRSAVGSV